ncbi:mechanosensitive ion channel, partial [bacterium]|nr:mechanosensitive ion channel [bacterium]
FPLIKLGESQITAWTIAYILLLLVILYTITNRMKHLVVDRLFAKSHIEYGTRQAIGTIVAYSIVLIGTLVILDSAGINLSALTIVAGALGIGIGFGLQNVTTNFISGIIVLLERPIKVGDRVQVEGATGDVIKISLRATTILTNDNIAVIVPNSEFVSSKVINWSHRNPDVRCNFPITVAYGTDPELVRDILLDIAENHPGVLKDKKADVLLDQFGDTGLNLTLRVWTRTYTSKPGVLHSEINYEIARKFEQHGIQIPSPQRDVYVRGGEIKVMPD